jgi:hypothetical protein
VACVPLSVQFVAECGVFCLLRPCRKLLNNVITMNLCAIHTNNFAIHVNPRAIHTNLCVTN